MVRKKRGKEEAEEPSVSEDVRELCRLLKDAPHLYETLSPSRKLMVDILRETVDAAGTGEGAD